MKRGESSHHVRTFHQGKESAVEINERVRQDLLPRPGQGDVVSFSHTLSHTHSLSLSLSPAERALGGKAPKPKLKPKPKPLLERVAKHTRKGRSTEEGPKLGCPKALPQMIVRTSEWIQRCNGATGEGTTERREFNSDGDEKECVCLAGNKAGMVSGWARSRGTGLRD